jgi:hypothetical protein
MQKPFIPYGFSEKEWYGLGIETQICTLRNISKTEYRLDRLKTIRNEIEILIDIKKKVEYLTEPIINSPGSN